jgi:poly(A) polymerase
MTPPRRPSSRPTPDHGDAIVLEAPELARDIRGEPALRVIERLQRQGHEAYLVGGCVRDLLIGVTPKDFDVATSARPRQVKNLFPRNSFIIGRRFKLVHVKYGQDTVIETATFRAEPSPAEAGDDLLIVEDNTFGTAQEDARRRDFTVNGLLYDPSREIVIDHVGGLDDLDEGLLRTIGDPFVRIPEDPVRILRAIKFATRLGFHIEDETWDAMCDASPDLERAAPPRILLEIQRLLTSGTALGAFQKLRHCGALDVILPEVGEHLGDAEDGDPSTRKRAALFMRQLEALDGLVHDGATPSTALCVALLFHDIYERQANPETRTLPGEPPTEALLAGQVLERFVAHSRLAKSDAGRARKIMVQQARFLGPFGRRFRPLLFCLNPEFDEALDLFRLRCEARGEGWDIYKSWLERREEARALDSEGVEEEKKKARRTRRRRRSGRPRRRSGSGG